MASQELKLSLLIVEPVDDNDDVGESREKIYELVKLSLVSVEESS